MYQTKKEIAYKSGPYYKVIAVIPAGTECIPATNLPIEKGSGGVAGFWANEWKGMSENEKSWARNYGFLLNKSEVEEV